MTAKSAPQLGYVLFRLPTLSARSQLLLVLMLVLGAMAWLLDQHDQRMVSETPSVPVVLTDGVASAAEASGARTETAAPPENSRFRALSEFLSRRYKVSQAITLDLVTIAHTAGHQIGLDPLLIIAVMAVESRFNPIAESVMGAKGLMQVIPRYHVDKFREYGGEKYAVFDPETNILVGTQILKDYIAQTGSLNGALQMYVGASSEEDDPYIGKVMTEKQRLQQVIVKSRGRPEIEAAIVGQQLANLTLREPVSR